MDESSLIGLLMFLAGLFTLAGAAMDWDWFMNHRKARIFVKLLGRNGARVFYALLGIFFLALGVLALVGILNPG